MGKLQLGKLQHKVSFYRDATVINPSTGEQENQVQTIKANRWGSVKYIGSPSAGSSEEELNDQRTGKIKIEVQCRFFTGLRFEDWIEFEGGRFRIYSIQTLGRNEGYSLRAELRDDDSPALPTGAILDANANLTPTAEVSMELDQIAANQSAIATNVANIAQNVTDIAAAQTTADQAFTVASNNNGDINTINQQLLDNDFTSADKATLDHFTYDPVEDKLIADRAIETTLNSLFLGEVHKMSSGAENIFFTNLGSDINFYPMWGGLRDQSLTANQGAYGYIPPSGRVYTDMFSLPLGGNPDPVETLPYAGPNFFAVSIAGLGITTIAGQEVAPTQHLEYRLSVNGLQVYIQQLKDYGQIYPGDQIEWFFDHPVEIHAGTTIYAEIRVIDTATDVDQGQMLVKRGQTPNADGSYRYHAIVHNRLFEDKDIEFISPFLKYSAMDFSLDATGSSVILKDLTQATDEQFLKAEPINTLEAVVNGTNIRIKSKNGKKIIVEDMPVAGATINGTQANSVLADAVTSLNNLFTNVSGFGGSGASISDLSLTGNTLTLTLSNGTDFDVDVTSLGVDENSFVNSGALSGTTLILTLNDGSTVNVDASSLAVDEDTTVVSGAVNGFTNTLTLTMSDNSTIDIGVSLLAIDEDTTVVSGSVTGNDLTLTMSDSSTVVIDATSLAINSNDMVDGGSVSGNTLTLSLTDGSTVDIDVTSLATDLDTDTDTTVVSGVVTGTNLVLTMSDSTTVTIDATNMVNGSTDTSAAPDVSDQVIEVTENQSFSATIALDANSDIATMFDGSSIPSWAALNQSTGEFLGTAPSFNNSGASGANDYVVACKAANPIGGITNFNVTLRVTELTYTNTKSLNFANGVSSFLGGNANSVTSLERSGNGSGASEAWSIGMWIKPVGSTTQGQTLFYFGSSDITNGGHMEIRKIQSGGNNRIRLRYGSSNNYIQVQSTSSGTIMPNDQWAHILVTYDGGTTGASSGDITSYYSRFKIFINGVNVATNFSHGNYGWSGSLTGQNYRWGRYLSGNYPRNIRFNQMCIWNSDQQSNIAGIYNGGSTQDMTDSTTMEGSVNTNYQSPAHYYEFDDSVTAIPDITGSVPLVGYNFSSSDLVTDAP